METFDDIEECQCQVRERLGADVWVAPATSYQRHALGGGLFGVLSSSPGAYRDGPWGIYDECTVFVRAVYADARGALDWPQITQRATGLEGTSAIVGRYLYEALVYEDCAQQTTRWSVRSQPVVRWIPPPEIYSFVVTDGPSVEWAPEETAVFGWEVSAWPYVRWRESGSNLFDIIEIPVVRWEGTVEDLRPADWSVVESPQVRWVVNPGAIGGECVTGEGTRPGSAATENFVF